MFWILLEGPNVGLGRIVGLLEYAIRGRSIDFHLQRRWLEFCPHRRCLDLCPWCFCWSSVLSIFHWDYVFISRSSLFGVVSGLLPEDFIELLFIQFCLVSGFWCYNGAVFDVESFVSVGVGPII